LATGVYRIVAVAGDGASCTIENLDMTAKTFTTTASALSWSIWDAVQPEDMIVVGTHKLCIEKLLSTASAAVRVFPGATLSNQNWSCYKPSWRLVKRVSPGIGYDRPHPYDNGTFMSIEEWTDVGRYILSLDLADLSTAQRSGRFWRFSMMPLQTAGKGTLGGENTLDCVSFYDTTGKLIGSFNYNRLDGVDENADFMACNISRLDWIQASNEVQGGAIYGGLASVGGADKKTVTLDTGGNVFAGFQIRTGSSASMTVGGTTLDITGADAPFVSSDEGRIIHITGGGANDGYYRISGVISATQIEVVSPEGNVVMWAATLTGQSYVIYDDIAASDYIAFYTSTNGPDVKEYQIVAIADDLTSLTLDRAAVGVSGMKWEVRRRASIQVSSAAGPVSAGQISQGIDGQIEFWPDDVRSRPVLTNGATTSGTNTLTAAAAADVSVDDVGRLVVISSGADKGVYKILGVAGTALSLGHLKDGAVANMSATDAAVSYQVIGDRRYRASRYVAILRG